jgi:hypothetical protein
MRNGWGNEETTCERFVDCGQEVCSHPRFHHIAKCSGSEAGTDEIGVGMNRQENDLGCATGLIQLVCRLDAVQDWHRNIGDDDVRFEVHGGLKQRATVRHTSNDMKGWSNKAFHHLQEVSMVVCQEYSDLAQ